ncbi:MAG: type IV pilus secretin PilQ [Acidobacteriota bacterium]
MNRIKRRRAQIWLAVAASSLVLLWAGCASTAAPRSTTDEGLIPAAAPEGVGMAEGSAGQTSDAALAMVRSVELMEGAPDAALRVTSDAPLTWTGYRDEEGRLIVELPNSRLAPGVPDELAGAGFVRGVVIGEEMQAGQPMTRIAVESAVTFEHSMAGAGESLEIFLTPTDAVVDGAPAAGAEEEPATQLAYEPLPASEVVVEAVTEEPAVEAEPMPPEAPAEVAYVGTADEPLHAPPPSGPLATRLEGVEVLPSARGTAVRIAGDGEFSYSTFALDEPYRFVVDLEGVINESTASALMVDGVDVARVRMAQFRPYPEPVTRVVFDLEDRLAPQVERTGEGLVVRFGPAAAPTEAVADLAGVGAENNIPTQAAQGGSEVDAYDTAAEVAYDEADTYSFSEEQEPVVEAAVADDELESYDVEVASIDDGETMQEPVVVVTPEPEEPSAAPVQVPVQVEVSQPASSTSDLDLFRRAEIKLEEPSDPASGTQSFTAQSIGGQEREYVGDPISFSLRDSDLVETLRAFAVLSGLNLVIQPGVTGSVTVELMDVPWDQAFEQILKMNGLGYELEGNVMRIAPVTTLRAEAEERQRLEAARALSVPLLTIIKRLSYANAGAVAGLLSSQGGVLSQRGSVIVDQRTNTLIIKELPSIMDTVIAVIESVDTAEPQVMIEARIIETRKSFTQSLGVDWSFGGIASAATGNPTGLVFPGSVDSSGGVNLVTGGNAGFLNLALGSLAGTFNINASLVAAENEGLINVLSAPKVSTLNNEQASIQSGFQIPIQTVSNNTVSVQFIEATLKLEVTPQVTAEGTILMDINIQKRNPEFALAVQGANAAPIATQEAQTRVIVRDGGTTVIGGIYEVSSNDGQDRVPGLANVPIIGHLFKNRRREDQNNELLIFITPRVMRL